MIKRNRAYQQKSARLTSWLDGLANFKNSIRYTAGENLAKTDHLSRHPTEEATTEENDDEVYAINVLSKLFKLNHKNGQLLNTDRKFRPTDQSTKMTLKANRESTNEIASPEKFDLDVFPKDFTREQSQANNSIKTEFNLIDKSNKFCFADSKIDKQFNHDYHHGAANKEMMEIINKREKSPEILRLIAGRK